MSQRQEKIEETIRHAAATFIEESSNRDALITVTGIMLSGDERRAKILITVLPENKEKGVISFLNRKRSEFFGALKEKLRVARLPSIEFFIDEGEKNRQKIDGLLARG